MERDQGKVGAGDDVLDGDDGDDGGDDGDQGKMGTPSYIQANYTRIRKIVLEDIFFFSFHRYQAFIPGSYPWDILAPQLPFCGILATFVLYIFS